MKTLVYYGNAKLMTQISSKNTKHDYNVLIAFSADLSI